MIFLIYNLKQLSKIKYIIIIDLKYKNMKIISFSDTHGNHKFLNFEEEYDIALFSGDAGTYRNPYQNKEGILDFIEWYSSHKNIKHKVWIAGNHCTSIEHRLVDAKKLSEEKGIIYLEHEQIEINGLKIFGSPYTPRFGYGWAFNIDRGSSIKRLWSQIPDDTDILLVHGPPYEILDKVQSGEFVGCKDLSERIKELKNLKLVHYGHIHESYGYKLIDEVYFVNASVLNLEYKLTNKPFVFEVDENKRFEIIQ